MNPEQVCIHVAKSIRCRLIINCIKTTFCINVKYFFAGERDGLARLGCWPPAQIGICLGFASRSIMTLDYEDLSKCIQYCAKPEAAHTTKTVYKIE